MMITGNAKRRLISILLAVLLTLPMAIPAVAETFSAIVTADEMTAYKDAKLKNAAGTIEKDAVVRITAYNDKAAQFTWRGQTLYARISDLQAVEDVAKKAVTNTASTVYQSPAAGAKSSKVRKGTKLYVLAVSDPWAQVEKGGVVGYIHTSDLTYVGEDWTVAPTPTPAATPSTKTGYVTASSLPVYQEASAKSKKLGTMKKGQTLNILSYEGSWAYVELYGRYGYCAVDGLSESSPAAAPTGTPAANYVVTVTTASLPVYKKPQTSSSKLGTLKKGQQVTLIAQVGEWAYIGLDSRRGYCKASGLGGSAAPTTAPTPAPTATANAMLYGRVTEDQLNVYKTARSGDSVVMTLKKGDVVKVIKWNNTWAYIQDNGSYGFCDIDALMPATEAAAVTPAPTPASNVSAGAKANVTEESAPVYKVAGDASTLMGTLMWGEEVNVISVEDGWAYIEKAGKYGFCRADALSDAEADPDDIPTGYKTANFTATVVDPDAKSYTSESTSGTSTKLTLGQSVSVTAYSSDESWAIINRNNTRAFVPIKYLSRAAYPTVQSTGEAMQALLKALVNYGYYDGVPSVSPDSDMATAAIKRFQAACGLAQTGVADEVTQRVLYAGKAPTSPILADNLSSGSKGEHVTRLQTRLHALGYLSKTASIDGDFGNTTMMAIGLFQKANGINTTGTANTTTLKVLYSAGAASKPSGVKAADGTGTSSSTSTSTSTTSSGGAVNVSGTVSLSSTYVTTMPSQLKSSTTSFSSSLSNAKKLEYVIYVAQSNLGKPYVYGATGTSSFDCSGLTTYSFKKAGINLKRTAYSQGYDTTYTKISSISDLKRGDLIFFNTISDSDQCDHVGIYLGGKCFIHASSGGHKVVVSSVASGYYNRVFSWGRRILK